MAVSLDGFATDPDDDLSRIHAWRFDEQPATADAVAEFMATGAAVLAGRRTFDQGEGPWGDEPPFPMPVFVITHTQRAPLTKGQGTFTFVDGIEPALEQAHSATPTSW